MSYYVEKGTNDIVISGWEEGILDNPYEGIYDMRNCEVVSVPGEISVANKTETMQSQGAISAVSFTVNSGTGVFTYDGVVPLEVNTAIYFIGADLPSGLSEYTAYYVLTTPTSATFTISAMAGGTQTTVSDTGSGTMTFTTIQMGTPQYYAKGYFEGRNMYFMSDDLGRTWVYSNTNFGNTSKWVYMNNRTSENPSTSYWSQILGLVYYKEFLISFTTTYINAIWLFSTYYSGGGSPYLQWITSGHWSNNWQSCGGSSNSTSESRQAISAPNDLVYFCNQHYVGSIDEVDGDVFSLAETKTTDTGVTTEDSSTITTTDSFFASKDVGSVIVGIGIPTGSRIIHYNNSKSVVIDKLATASGTLLTFTITQSYTYSPEALFVSTSDIVNCLSVFSNGILIGGLENIVYYWDLLSQGWNYPIYLSENKIKRIVTSNNTAYIFAGTKGRIFVTNGGNATPFWKIPEYLSNTTNPYIFWTDAVRKNNQLYFGFQVKTNGGTTINQYGGLWAVDIDAVSPVYPRLQNQLSYATYSGYVSALCDFEMNTPFTNPSSDGYGLFIGWNDGSVGGIDKGISTPYTNYESYAIGDPIPVGTFLDKRNYTSVEFKLASPIVSGEKVRISWRTNLSDSFTVLGETTTAGAISDVFRPNFMNVQWLQLKVELSSTATTPSYVRLRELRIH